MWVAVVWKYCSNETVLGDEFEFVKGSDFDIQR